MIRKADMSRLREIRKIISKINSLEKQMKTSEKEKLESTAQIICQNIESVYEIIVNIQESSTLKKALKQIEMVLADIVNMEPSLIKKLDKNPFARLEETKLK